MKVDSYMDEKVEDDMMKEILLHLPVKTVATFKCTSRKWNSFISESSWFRAQYTEEDMLMLGIFFQRRTTDIVDIRFHPTTYQGEMLKDKLEVENDQVLVAGSNGFLLTYNKGCSHYIITNPITKETFHLPNSKIVKHHGWFSTVGFTCKLDFSHGRSPTISYKMVLVMMLDYNHLVMEFISDDMHEWDVLTLHCPSRFGLDYMHNVVISEESGKIYFPVRTKSDPAGVVVYDQSKENSFHLEMTVLPETANGYKGSHFGQTNGSIVYGLSYTNRIDLWVLDEHDSKEWSLRYQINNLELKPDVGIVGFHPLNPGLLFLWKNDEKLVSYNVKNQKTDLVPLPPLMLKELPSGFPARRWFFPYIYSAPYFLFGKDKMNSN